eukprot:2127329-Prymnesium_polylepis.2
MASTSGANGASASLVGRSRKLKRQPNWAARAHKVRHHGGAAVQRSGGAAAHGGGAAVRRHTAAHGGTRRQPRACAGVCALHASPGGAARAVRRCARVPHRCEA